MWLLFFIENLGRVWYNAKKCCGVPVVQVVGEMILRDAYGKRAGIHQLVWTEK